MSWCTRGFIYFVFTLSILIALPVKSADFLPSGWTAHSSQGKTYYYNQRTGASQWEKPVSTESVISRQNLQYQHGQGIAASTANGWTDHTAFQQQQNGGTPHSYPSAQQVVYKQQRRDSYTQSTGIRGADTAGIVQRPQSATTHTLQQSSASTTAAVATAENMNNATITQIDASTSSDDLIGFESAENLGTLHRTSSPEQPATLIEDNRYTHDPIKESFIKSAKSSSDTQRLISEIEEADRQIVDLNDMIDELEAEKEILLQRVKSGEEAMKNVTLSLQAAALVQEVADLRVKEEMELRITALKEELITRQEELETLKAGKEILEVDLDLLKISTASTITSLAEIRLNFTVQSMELRVTKARQVEQEKELSDAYKEIGQLEDDMKNVAEPSLRRLRQPSFFSRILERAFPVWVGGKGSSKSGKRAKGRTASAVTESMQTMNRTMDSLRENLTAMAAAMEGKAVLIEELSEQLAERVEEAEKRRESYAALKDGVDSVQEDNEKLEEEIAAREIEIADLSARLIETTEAGDLLRELLRDSTEAFLRCEESNSEDRAQYVVSLSLFEEQLQLSKLECEAKELQACELRSSLQSHEMIEQTLRSQLSNLKLQLEESLRREQVQIEAKNTAEQLLKEKRKHKPWFLLFWPF